jgi:hypothetical protein
MRKAYAILQDIHDTHVITASQHLYEETVAGVTQAWDTGFVTDLRRKTNFLRPYWRRAQVLYYVHRGIVVQGRSEVLAITNVSEAFRVAARTIKKWKKEFYLLGFRFRRLLSGTHLGKSYSYLDDKDIRRRARAFLRNSLAADRRGRLPAGRRSCTWPG